MSRVSNPYGWLPDHPDFRDKRLALPPARFTLPRAFDLREKMPPVYNQGALGSCTANAIAAAMQYERRRQNLPDDFTPSRLFVYYNERVKLGTVDSDSGAFLRDGIKSLAQLGDCPEFMWPYDTARFTVEPDAACYSAAVKYKSLDYWRVPRIPVQMKGCLVAGFPFVFGFSVYASFESGLVASSGRVPMPDPAEQMVGGHAVLAVGYDDAQGVFICRNSWGDGWGDKGYFYLPYAYVNSPDLADDFWTLKLVAA